MLYAVLCGVKWNGVMCSLLWLKTLQIILSPYLTPTKGNTH